MNRHRGVLLGLVLCLLLLPAAACAEAGSDQLRIMTFNVRVDEGTGAQDQWEQRRDRQIQLVEEHGPDVVGLQEVLKHQLDYFIDNLEDYSMVGEGLRGGTSREHNAIFFRRDRFYLREAGSFVLPKIPDRVTWVRLASRDGQELYVLNTHMHQQENDPLAWTILLEKAREFFGAGERPVFLLGDMNERAGESVAWAVLNRAPDGETFKDAWLYSQNRLGPVKSSGFAVGNESFEPLDWIRRIDWILYMGDLTPVSIDTITTDRLDGHYSSDHRAVQAVFEFESSTYEPAELDEMVLEYLDVNVAPNEVFVGDTFTVDLRVRNQGGIGRAPIALLVNDDTIDTKEAFFNTDEEKTIQFELRLFQPGEYTVGAESGASTTVEIQAKSFF